MAVTEIVEGWTEPLEWLLLNDGAAPSQPLTGTIEPIIKDANGIVVDVTGDSAIVDAATWKVRYTPDAADFTVGTYTIRWQITQGGAVFFFPNGAPDIIRVYRP